MDMDIAREFGSLISEKRKLEARLDNVKEQIASLEPTLLNELVEAQVDRLPITLEGEKVTLYIHRQLWAKPKDGNRAAVVDALRGCGLEDLVKEDFNTSTLSAYVRERLGDGEDLEAGLHNALWLDEVVSIRGRRSPVSSESKTAKAMKTLRR